LYQAEVVVTLKPVVNDPQGLTIKSALHALGFGAVEDVRAGKILRLTLDTDDETQAREMTEAMASQLLANSVIEDYEISLLALKTPARGRSS
jgi:phosphoribosylformylglycinamidine synthase subunit PurS